MEQTHEHTPITGNLRHAMVQWGWADGREVTITDLQPSIDAEPFLTIRGGRFGELCDAIDAIHVQLERENAELKAELARVQGEQEDHRSCIYYDPKRNYCSWHDIDTDALVELPKDADKAHICVGDKLDGYGKTIEVVELRYGRSGWVLISRDGNAYADTFAFTHHHPDTWERIIEDALGSRWSAPNELSSDFTALVARCKKLAGEAE